eukprot:TRINITY_DN2838_c0_g1_i20.p1 TRINITY_DN2838_c0_g1~~TRINITY_DN2838_c0_g1_i20.p1  ORF type:complete len:379 (-),score=25.41 TRINITY_DN2838_c0_g1_i20:141-1277(-)
MCIRDSHITTSLQLGHNPESLGSIKEELEEDSILTAKDIADLNKAVKMEIDCIGIPEIRHAKHVKEVKHILGAKSKEVKLLAKIQNREALEAFDEILHEADGIMISRGYLGIHLPIEKLYLKEREIIKKCHEARKPVIIIGQLLESMIKSLIPTGSEINDLGNLVMDGADCLCLVHETTHGRYPKECVETLSRICLEIESKMKCDFFSGPTPDYSSSVSSTIAFCCIQAVRAVKAELIIVLTHTGSTVIQVSKLKPPCPILAITHDEKVARVCSFLAGAVTMVFGSMVGKDALLKRAIDFAKEAGLIECGKLVICTYGDRDGVPGHTNTMRIIPAQIELPSQKIKTSYTYLIIHVSQRSLPLLTFVCQNNCCHLFGCV